MTLRKGLTNVGSTACLAAVLQTFTAIAADPLRAPNELPSRLTIASFDEEADPASPPEFGKSPAFADAFNPQGGPSRPAPWPAPNAGASESTHWPPAGPGSPELVTSSGAANPCLTCPDPSSEYAKPGRLRSFVERWAPEGVVPYWGCRTPDWRKDLGIGEPLQSGGWRTQPFSISGFSGATNGGPLIRNHVHEVPSYYGGVNFGWDYDHYWGIEKRLGFGALNLTNSRDQRLQTGLSVTGEYRLMYYPLGDSRWRPFLTTGIGWSDFYFRDDVNHQHLDTLFLFPFGVGIKYLWCDRWALRIDLIDELTLGSHLTSTFHYVALTAGLEFRYGQRLLRFPWTRHL